MNLDSIFNLFNNEDNTDETSLLVDFSEHPLFWISGFNKVIANHVFFKEHTVKSFRNIYPDINIEELEKVGEELMFRKAWDFIKSIDVTNNFHIECIKLKTDEYFIHNLKVTIKFFEDLEEYEKCALLKKVEDKVTDFLI